MDTSQITNNKKEKRFELKINNHLAIIIYEIKNNKIYLVSTEVTESLSGQGIGSKLVKQSLDLIQDMDLKVVPVCPFIQTWFKRHPEKENLLA
ncbi:MAG: N-acetyltransferase [Bacteroidales bacterium]|nr:N-acetyltransferase [Bacteroidales bacterium]MCF8402732.1 N-acetyltransferase [Bacteroidales bacterium]